MCTSNHAPIFVSSNELSKTNFQPIFAMMERWPCVKIDCVHSWIWALEEMMSILKMWTFSGFLFVLIFVCYPSSAHCVSGADWQKNGTSPKEDVGANSYTTAYLNISYTDPETRKLRTEKSEIGKFGDGRVGPASGILVHVSSWEGEYTACATPLRNSFGNGSLPQEPWIALVKRGQCNFEVKVENAFRHNATAILVYNDRESATLDKMKLSASRNMSAVFTYMWKGEQLAKLLDNGSRVVVHITVATHCTRPTAHVNRTSVLFVSISFVVLMLTSFAWLVFYYVQRFRYLHAKEKLSKRLCCAAKRALSKIPTKEIRQEDHEVQGEGECCAVCIEPYKVTDDLRVLPCKHEFHKWCIDPWLLERRTCPMCKMNILKHFGFKFSTSQESILQVDVERGANEDSATEVRTENEAQEEENSGNPSTSSDIQLRIIYSEKGCSNSEEDEQRNQLLKNRRSKENYINEDEVEEEVEKEDEEEKATEIFSESGSRKDLGGEASNCSSACTDATEPNNETEYAPIPNADQRSPSHFESSQFVQSDSCDNADCESEGNR